MLKKSVIIGLTLILTIFVASVASAERSAKSNDDPIKEMETKKASILEKHYKKAHSDSELEIVREKVTRDSLEGKQIREQIYEKEQINAESEIKQLLNDYGWVEVPNPDPGKAAKEVAILSISSNAIISNTLYINTQNGSFRAESIIDWATNTWDQYGDAEDKASIGANKAINITQTYGNVYDWLGSNQGSSSNGTWTSGSLITDGQTLGTGKIWNIIDNASLSDRINLVIYFTAPASTTLYTSYAHNYKDRQADPSAGISFTGLNVTGQLTISYSYVNRSWGPTYGPPMSTSNPS
ncbi:hypothetical protein [Cohnella silvisoli]|uniref:Uncharacterized protein n=1 Tax=Cohnella silvisoli TaxID=2873699 RepID=A0ABV1L1I3_9BACL|nr:hypothetical protein [Cohnella silvisoli]MCD9025049.1 hypothetical protein [Cohnella silvisoli]